MADGRARLISLDDEVEGDRDATDDFVFCRIGEPIPLKPSDSKFDLEDPLRRPLAVSERFRALFLANSEGFLVVLTKDAIGLAKEIKEKGKGSCMKNSSLADVNIGRVSILALSDDSSVLAAATGSEIHFFFVPSLLNKEEKPSFSCSLKKSGIVKDFRWQKSAQKSFLVLSNDGSLYHGHIKDNQKHILENVDAVDWSVDGNHFAVARKNIISVFSSDFQEQYCISLLFQSWPTDAESESYIKVDSIEWVRKNSILVGCVRVNEDNEEGYLLQMITSQKDDFSEPVVFSFPDVFEGILDDILPTGAGPYLLSSYMERWGTLIASNRKNIDQHILLLKYSIDENKKEVSSLEFKSDKYKPTISLQENGDDNMVWGLGIDKVSVYEKVKIQVDLEFKELSPYCVLFCLTSDGRLFMYHVARISDPFDLPKSLDFSDIQLESELLETNRQKDDAEGLVSVNVAENISKSPDHTEVELKKLEKKNIDKAVVANIIPSKEDESNEAAVAKTLMREPTTAIQSRRGANNTHGSDSIERRSSMQEFDASSTKSGEITISPSGELLNQESVKNQITAAEISSSENAGKDGLSHRSGEAFSFPFQTTMKLFGSDGFNSKASPSASVGPALGTKGRFEVGTESKLPFSFQKSLPTDLSGSSAVTSSISTNQSSALMFSSTNTDSSERYASSSTRKEDVAIGKSISMKQQFPDSARASSTSQTFDSEPGIVKQVKDMMKELDNLLLHIQKEGGFRDACTVSLQGSLLTLEEGLKNLTKASKYYKSKIEEELKEIQELQSKMLQVSAKQVYMEGILRQASDSQYWDIWNRQKLSPEFEQKRQLILRANQELTNQLVELERYFNTLEISKFGESSRASTNRRVFHGNMGQARQIQSMHSVFNTLNSQLATAEQLSECLSKQMDILNINSTPSKRDAITRELFESIGISHDDCAFRSPDVKGPCRATDSVNRYSSSTVITSKDYTKRIASSALKSSGSESTRRRKDSLDRSWAENFEPQKTTVKRTARLGHQSIRANTPFTTAKQSFDSRVESFANIQQKATETQSSLVDSLMKKAHSDTFTLNKGIEEKISKQAIERQSTSALKWAKEPLNSSKSLNLQSCFLDDLQKNIHNSAMVASSTSILNFPQNTQGNFGLHNTGSNMTATAKTVVDLNTGPDTQLEFSSSTMSPLKLSSEISLVGSPQTSESKSLLNKRQGPMDFRAVNLQGSINNPVSSLQGFPVIPSVSSIPAEPSSGPSVSIADTRSKDQAMKTTSASTSNSKIESKSSISSLPTSAPVTLASLSTVSVLPATSFSAIGVGGSSLLNAKDVKETSLTHAASSTSVASTQSLNAKDVEETSLTPAASSTSVASSQSLSFNSRSSQLSGSLAMTANLPSSVGTTSGLQFSHLNDAKLVTEATPQAAENERAAFTNIQQAISPLPKNDGLFGSSSQLDSSSTSGTNSIQAGKGTLPEISTSISAANTTPVVSRSLDNITSQEDEMEEEAPDNTNVLSLGNLGGFGLGSQLPSSAAKSNPFGGTFITANTNNTSSPIALTTSPGQLFRPPSFNLPTPQPMQPSQPITSNAFSGGSSPGLSGFGQPAQVGAGQQALGSVLGAFGQSRQIGAVGFGAPAAAPGEGFTPGGGFAGAAAGGGGGFTSFSAKPGGFAGAATGGGFSAVASAGSGFANAAVGGAFGAASGGGFSSAATGGGFGASSSGTFTGGGGFAAIASKTGGFAAAASQGGGFGGSAAGGFGAFSGNQGSAFSAFGGNSGTGAARPLAELFTQMRK